MKDYNFKPLIKLTLVLLLFYCSSLFVLIPIYLFRIDVKTCSDTVYNILRIIPNVAQTIILFFIYRKELVKEFKSFVKHFGEYSDVAIKYWILGFIFMVVSNYLIMHLFPVKLANNEVGVREIINTIPIISILVIGLLSPFGEEIIFRKSFKDCIKEKWLFVLTSGIVFGLLHVITSFNSLYDLLYVIPYSGLGIAFALIYYKTDNIYSSIAAHALHNTMLVILNIVYAGVILL